MISAADMALVTDMLNSNQSTLLRSSMSICVAPEDVAEVEAKLVWMGYNVKPAGDNLMITSAGRRWTHEKSKGNV